MSPATRTSSRKKKPSSSPLPISQSNPTPEETLLALSSRLIHLCSQGGTLEQVKKLFDLGAPGWYQEETMGWSCLHFATERGDWRIVKLCLENGAVWNSADFLGRTAGDIALSQNDEKSYMLIRNEGIRQEMIHHAMRSTKSNTSDQAGPSSPSGPSTTTPADPTDKSTFTSPSTEHIDIHHDTSTNTYHVKPIDPTSAGDNHTFLRSKLTWDRGEDGKERVLDEDGNGVMMGWEEPLMVAHVLAVKDRLRDKLDSGQGVSVLNIGFGLGIIDTLLQTHLSPVKHTIIEAHPSVLAHIQSTPFHDRPGVNVLSGRWQDWCSPDKVVDLLGLSEGGQGYDFVFIDTFAEDYEELKAFFEIVTDLLEGPDSVFSFWNGLGATNPLIYDVACNLAEMHMDDVGLQTEWHDVLVDDATAVQVWKGVKRSYWNLPVYRMPVASYSM